METCKYQEVETTETSVDKDNKFQWTPFLRQKLVLNSVTAQPILLMFELENYVSALTTFVHNYSILKTFVCSGVWSISFLLGLSFGAPTVLIQQIRQEANSTEAISEDMASWISSALGFSGLGWLIPLWILVGAYGRRISFMIVTLNSLVGFIVFYCSNTPEQILIAQLMQGAARTGMTTVLLMIGTEYPSPQHRGLLLTMDTASFFWGVWVANTMGTFLHWKNIGIPGILCSFYSMTALLWPESPYWLASKGRFEECAAAHRWLKGSSVTSEDELKTLINSSRLSTPEMLEKQSLYQKLSTIIKERDFYKPFLLIIAIKLLSEFSGKINGTMYAIEMIKKMTNSTNAAYSYMLILDGLTVFSTYIGCGFSRFVKRRSFYLGSSLISIFFMFMISLYFYLIARNMIFGNNILTVVLLSGYSISISLFSIFGGSITGEIIPVKHKNTMLFILSLFSQITASMFLKMVLLIFRVLGMHGTFLLYAIPSTIFLSFLYKYLPETKDKTLIEIEECFKNN